jgi:hypothetical protein
MKTVDVQVPDELEAFVELQVAERGLRNASDYFVSLAEADRHRTSDSEIEQLLDEAIDGPFSDWTESDVEDIRQVGTRLIEMRKRKQA